MNEELMTERLVLKRISKEDREFILGEYSDKTINRYMFQDPILDLNAADKMIEGFVHPDNKVVYRWIIIRRSDGVKMGTCGFHDWVPSRGIIELGYDMKEEFWGNGYMTEAVKRCIRYIISECKVKKIHANIYYKNKRSIALVKKLGFVYSQKAENYSLQNKEYLLQVYVLDCTGDLRFLEGGCGS